MTTTQNPAIGKDVEANGIRTNYLESGSGGDHVLVHGSGPGVTSYANWRLDELAEVRYQGATQPGFQESFSAMFPPPRQRWVEAMRTPEEEIRKLPHRTLVLHGHEDKVIPLANSYQLEEPIHNADLGVFSHCGHWSMIGRTADFNRLVRDFFLGD